MEDLNTLSLGQIRNAAGLLSDAVEVMVMTADGTVFTVQHAAVGDGGRFYIVASPYEV